MPTFHLRPAAYGEMLISTTTSMGRTKILQFLPLRPPLGRTTKTCFCVGSDGHIRVECGSTHPSTRGYMILATTNPHSSPIQPNPHKSLQYLANHKVYIESNASFEYISCHKTQCQSSGEFIIKTFDIYMHIMNLMS